MLKASAFRRRRAVGQDLQGLVAMAGKDHVIKCLRGFVADMHFYPIGKAAHSLDASVQANSFPKAGSHGSYIVSRAADDGPPCRSPHQVQQAMLMIEFGDESDGKLRERSRRTGPDG